MNNSIGFTTIGLSINIKLGVLMLEKNRDSSKVEHLHSNIEVIRDEHAQEIKQVQDEQRELEIVSRKSDLTQGSIWKHILRIATPAILGQIFSSLYNWVDTFWGGRISTDALAAFSLSFPPFLLAIAAGQCFAGGGMVLVSNALGAKETTHAKSYLKQTVLSSALGGVVIMCLVLLFGKEMLMVLGAKDQVLRYSVEYLSILSIGMPFMMIFFALNIGFVSQGNTKFMRNILIMNTLINLGLDPLFLYGWKIGAITIIPAMGVKGIALATVIVQIIGVIIAWKKIQENSITKWENKKIVLELPIIKQILILGMPTFLQIGMAAIGLSLVNFFLSRLSGGVAVAAYGIGLRVEQLALVPTFGISMALSALVGQNNGAKNYLRVRESYIKAIIAQKILWLTTMLPVAIFGVHIARIFTTDIKTAQITYFYLSFAFLAFMAYQIMGASSGLLQGMKKPKIPMIVLTARQLVFPWLFIPLYAYKFGWGIYGVFASVVTSGWISALILLGVSLHTLRKTIKQNPTPVFI